MDVLHGVLHGRVAWTCCMEVDRRERVTGWHHTTAHDASSRQGNMRLLLMLAMLTGTFLLLLFSMPHFYTSLSEIRIIFLDYIITPPSHLHRDRVGRRCCD